MGSCPIRTSAASPARPFDTGLDGPSRQQDFSWTTVGHGIDDSQQLRHLPRRQHPQTRPFLRLGPEHEGELDPRLGGPPFGRHLNAPLFVHPVPVDRIVVRRFCSLFRVHDIFALGLEQLLSSHYAPLLTTLTHFVSISFLESYWQVIHN